MSATRPTPRPGVLDIQAYVPGKSSAPGVAKVFKLSSNETPLGPSPRAIAAYQAVGAHLEDYPDGSASDLREAAEVILRRDTPTLEETLRRDWPQLHGAWQAVKPFPQLSKRTSA